jgi:hypothetical protein
MAFAGIVSKRLGSTSRSGRSTSWIKVENPKAPAVKREAEEDWGNKPRSRWREVASQPMPGGWRSK